MQKFMLLPTLLVLATVSWTAPSTAAPLVEATLIEVYWPTSNDWGYCSDGSPNVSYMRVVRSGSTHEIHLQGIDPSSGQERIAEAVWDSASWLATGALTWPTFWCTTDADVVFFAWVFLDCSTGYVDVTVASATGSHHLTASGWGWCSTTTALDAQVDPPGSTLLAVSTVSIGTPVVGCAGTVQVTFTNGASLPLPGHRLSGTGCAAAPCDPWSTLTAVASCVANPIGCCVTLFGASGTVTTYRCLRETFVRVDVNDDGVWDVVVPAATLTSPPC